MASDANINGDAPPSTLAAQLVGNISTTARSSRPDESSELKRFFETIERVKNDPESLKTLEDRIEHNHLLIYVYACVVLEGLKWDDPFADRGQLTSEALKALRFLKVTIQETPLVLNYTVNDDEFLRRGTEPLWAWLFPKVFRMLGHPQCPSLNSPLEDFFNFIFISTIKSAGLWALCDLLYAYLQTNVRCKRGRPFVNPFLTSKLTNMASNPDTPQGISFRPSWIIRSRATRIRCNADATARAIHLGTDSRLHVQSG